jgi:hypothetical protein
LVWFHRCIVYGPELPFAIAADQPSAAIGGPLITQGDVLLGLALSGDCPERPRKGGHGRSKRVMEITVRSTGEHVKGTVNQAGALLWANSSNGY